MELVDGPTLAQKLSEDPIPFEEAIGIARQIADGVEAAHEKGIIHRDLKPGNIKLKPDGTVKVLDFGLAKLGDAAIVATEDSPTITMNGTQGGIILGTAAYMSPEQAKGKEVDKRADIWAFGVVLYEMLTGKNLFYGETLTDLLAAVIKEQPNLDAAPANTRRLLRRCLEKDPKNRLRDIGDAGVELREILETKAAEPIRGDGGPPFSMKGSRVPRWAWSVAAVTLLAVGIGVSWELLKSRADEPMLQMEVTPPSGTRFTGDLTPFALSPDGRKLAFLAESKDGKRMLWLRPIDTGSATALAGTEGGELPFWSPDSRWVGFSANGKLQKSDVIAGGLPEVISNIEGRVGGTWNNDGTIVFDQGGKLHKISASGGSVVEILPLDVSRGEVIQFAPYFLPDGQHLVYLSRSKQYDFRFASLDSRINRVIFEMTDRTPPTFASDSQGRGFLMYTASGQLEARLFDPIKGEFLSPPSTIARGVGTGRWWSAASNGNLAYRHDYGPQYQLAWFGREGKPMGTVGDPGAIFEPRISPNQKNVAFVRLNDKNYDLWTYDLEHNHATRFTFEPGIDSSPVWSADSQKITYESRRDAAFVVERPGSGVGPEAILRRTDGDSLPLPIGESRDGKWLALQESNSLREEIVLLSRTDPRKTIRVQERGTERDPSISPDGRWLVYSSITSGVREVLVQSMPAEAGGSANAGKWQISTTGGEQPMWSADGKEIFYVARDGMMMSVPIEDGPNVFRPGTPKALFQTRLEIDPPAQYAFGVDRQYDVTADGQRFLINQHVSETTDTSIEIVINWPKLLEKSRQSRPSR